MDDPSFNPGFRLSLFDVCMLAAGVCGGIYLSTQIWWGGMVVGFVVLHFFLFCNVFRISRIPELIWAAVYTVLAGATILSGFPGWLVTSMIAITLSSFLIWRETGRKHYHGVGWQRWNPSLPEWWKASREEKADFDPIVSD